MFKSESGLKIEMVVVSLLRTLVKISGFAYLYQLVRVIMMYRVANANIKWNKDQE